MPRPDYVHCIADREGIADGAPAREAWCGRQLSGFHFVDIDHAALNGRQEGRLVACSTCVREIVAALENGAEA